MTFILFLEINLFVGNSLLHKHGITLVPLSEAHIELLRNWRNSDFVKKNMQYQGHITETQQLKWFRSLERDTSMYFLIQQDTSFIGCCNMKNIDAELGCAEGGIFLSEEKYLNSLLPIKAIFILYDWVFSNTSVNIIKAEIIKKNNRAIRFNKGLGFTINAEVDNMVFATLTCDDFYSKYRKYKKVLDVE